MDGLVDDSQVCLHDRRSPSAEVLAIASLILVIANSASRTPEMAKKHAWSTVLTLSADSSQAGDPTSVDRVQLDFLCDYLILDCVPQCPPYLARRVG